MLNGYMHFVDMLPILWCILSPRKEHIYACYYTNCKYFTFQYNKIHVRPVIFRASLPSNHMQLASAGWLVASYYFPCPL